MIKTHILYIFFLFCIIASIFNNCKNTPPDKATPFILSDFKVEKKLIGERIILQGITDSRQMAHFNHFVICEEIKSDQLLTVFNIDTRQKEFGFLPKGRGPGELLDVTDMEINIYKNELLVFDAITDQFNVYHLDSLLIKKKRQPEFSGKINGSPSGEQLIKVNDSTYLGPGLSARFYIYNSKGIVTSKVGNYNFFNNSEKDTWLTQIYRGQIAYNYKSGKIAFLNKLTDIIEFYDENTLEKIIQGPNKFEAVYKIMAIDGGFALAHRKKHTRVAYNDTWSNDKYIFSLYSGKLWGDIGFHFSDVLTFSWDGKPLEHYILNIPIFAISVDAEKRIIYGLNDESQEPFLVKYNY